MGPGPCKPRARFKGRAKVNIYKETQTMNYRWIITRDRISEPGEKSLKGISGPSGSNSNLKTNPQRFSVYDDDNICYAEGILYSSDEALDTEEALFSPLDQYAGPALGCTSIKVDGSFI